MPPPNQYLKPLWLLWVSLNVSSDQVKEAVKEGSGLTQDHRVQDLEHEMLMGGSRDPDSSSLSWFHQVSAMDKISIT